MMKFGGRGSLGFEGVLFFVFFKEGFGRIGLWFEELVLVGMGRYESTGAVSDFGNFLTEHNHNLFITGL
jgi:hypothetical protein